MIDLDAMSVEELQALRQRAVAAQSIDPDLVRTVWGEARSEPPEGRKAVAAVVRNRAKLSGKPIGDVVRETGQFEPWGDPTTRQRMEALDPNSDEYQAIARDIADDEDPTGGATHFYSPNAQKALGRNAPAWDDGSGFDLGGHRFFKLAYGGQETEAPPDLDAMSVEELKALRERVAAEPAAADEPKADEPLSDVQMVGMPKTALKPKADMVFTDTEEPLFPGQREFYAAEIEAGRLDPAAVRSGAVKAGSEVFPLAQRDPKDLPKPGDWYVTPGGQKKQVPPIPWKDTGAHALAGLADLISPSPIKLESLLPDDPRFDAMTRGAQSGVLLGGRNELVAGIDALPKLFEGGVPLLTQTFGEALDREDRASGQARRDFPLVYDASAITGAVATGGVLPGGLAARLATGAGSGFLATDGDLKDRAIGAGVGAVGGEIAGRVLPKVVGGAMDLAGVPRRVSPKAWEEVDQTLTRMGVAPDGLRPEAREFIALELAKGVKPADAAVMALNKGLPREIPLIRGDITGAPGDQMQFNAALRGGRGDAAADVAQGIAAGRQDALRDIPMRIAEDMAGGAAARGRGGEMASEALARQRVAGKAGVDAKYEAARSGSGTAVLPQYDMEPLAFSMTDAVTAGHALRDVPKVAGHLRDIEALAAKGDVDIRTLFETRARLSALRADGGAEADAASKAIRVFDARMDDAISADLIGGDPAAAKRWKDAINANREHAEVFKQGDLVDRLTQETGSGSARRLAVDPGDAANYIFGRSALGGAGRQNLYRDLVKTRDLLGPDSEAWNGLRSEAFLRLLGAAEGGVEGGVQQVSGAKLQKAWNKMKGEDERLVNLLFKPEEKATIDQFAALSARVTSPVKGGDNPSNTAAFLKKMGSMSFVIGRAAPIVGRMVDVLGQQIENAAASRSMKPIPRKLPVETRGVPSAAGGYIGAEVATPR